MVFSILWHNFKIVLELSNPFFYCESKPGDKPEEQNSVSSEL